MAEESRNIVLDLGNVSLEEDLGTYYIDMTPAEIHYTQNIWGGCFDDNGVPMVMSSKGLYYFATNIAQYCFILISKYYRSKDDECLNKLRCCIDVLQKEKTEDAYTVRWIQNNDCERYNIKAPWVSSMAIGEVMSVFLRMYQIEGDESYLNIAKKAYEFLKIDVADGGVRRLDENGYLWFEEYPSDPPSYVLNGFIYTLFGLYDLYRVTGMVDVKNDIDECIRTLKDNLYRFDSGYWSNYDLRYRELVRYYYQRNVHVPQMKVLYGLTGEPIFLKYANKWERNVTKMNYAFVRIMYRVRPRLEFIKKKIKGK